MTNEQIAEDEALIAAATPNLKPVTDAQGICGIMDADDEPGTAAFWMSAAHNPARGYVGDFPPGLGRPQRQANAEFVLAARTRWPLYVAEVKRLMKRDKPVKVIAGTISRYHGCESTRLGGEEKFCPNCGSKLEWPNA